MKKIALYCDKFDPMNLQQVKFGLALIKKYNLDSLGFVCLEDDNLKDSSVRKNIINLQIEPYKKLFCISINSKIVNESIFYFKKDNQYYFVNNQYFKDNFNSEFNSKNIFLLNEDYQFDKKINEIELNLLSKKAKRYIIESGTYCLEILKSRVNEKRYLHSVSVANLCCQIAQAHKLDSYKAWLMGIYHDIAKGMSKDELSLYIDYFKPYEQTYDYHVWHQYVGMYVLKYKFKMQDEIILNAVRHHCLGDNKKEYAKILFIADKLDPSRGYDSSKQIELALKDIDKAYELVKKENEEYLIKTGVK